MEYLKVILYGVIEGITEWLPISSTGHLILAEKLLALPYPEEFLSMFRVVIQLGAILAVVVLYFPRLWPFTTDPRHKYQRPAVWQLWFKIFAATLPALVLGLLLDDWLDAHLYNYITVAAMLILYGVFFILIEDRRRRPTVRRMDQLTYRHALIIGCWQVLAMIPGTSRSGATIVGGLLLSLGLLLAGLEAWITEGMWQTPDGTLAAQYTRGLTRHTVYLLTADCSLTFRQTPFSESVGRCDVIAHLPCRAKVRVRAVKLARAVRLKLAP